MSVVCILMFKTTGFTKNVVEKAALLCVRCGWKFHWRHYFSGLALSGFSSDDSTIRTDLHLVSGLCFLIGIGFSIALCVMSIRPSTYSGGLHHSLWRIKTLKSFGTIREIAKSRFLCVCFVHCV